MKKFGGTVNIKSVIKSRRTTRFSQSEGPSFQLYRSKERQYFLAELALVLNSCWPAQTGCSARYKPSQKILHTTLIAVGWMVKYWSLRTRTGGHGFNISSFVICVNVVKL